MSEHDNFDMESLQQKDGQVEIVGGTWSSVEGGSTAEIRVSPRDLVGAIETAVQFEQQMRKIKTQAGLSPEQMKEYTRRVLDMAADEAVLNQWRQNRVAIGCTDHKALLEEERFRRAFQQMARVWRMAGIEIGWLGGFRVQWSFPYVRADWRPFDWQLDCKW